MKETYVSPKMDFEEVMVENAVAATCWGYHGTDTVMYADHNGQGGGYMSFQIGAGSCDLNLTNVYYYGGRDSAGEPASGDQYGALYSYLAANGGNDGQPFKGMGSVVIPGAPDPEWS